MSILRKTTSLSLLIVLAQVSAVAGATQPSRPQGGTVSVRYADLDVSRPAGAQTLLRRIRRGAQTACAAVGIADYPTYRRAVKKCIDEAVDNAVTQVGQPQLTAAYRGDRALVMSR